jgi:hypothetical protein
MTDRIDGDAIREGRQGQSLQQEPNYWQAVCPDKADMFSGNQSHQGKSQTPCSTGRICGGNEADEADRQSHLRDGERVTGPQRK